MWQQQLENDVLQSLLSQNMVGSKSSGSPQNHPFSGIFRETNHPGWWLTYLSEKYERQLGWLFPIYGKICSKPPTSIHLGTPTSLFFRSTDEKSPQFVRGFWPQRLHSWVYRRIWQSPAQGSCVASFFLSPLKLSPSPEQQKWRFFRGKTSPGNDLFVSMNSSETPPKERLGYRITIYCLLDSSPQVDRMIEQLSSWEWEWESIIQLPLGGAEFGRSDCRGQKPWGNSPRYRSIDGKKGSISYPNSTSYPLVKWPRYRKSPSVIGKSTIINCQYHEMEVPRYLEYRLTIRDTKSSPWSSYLPWIRSWTFAITLRHSCIMLHIYIYIYIL